ncbi:hypothetical protein BC829DRAFT_391562 [Chytridium lagenaria]|nr:hypothetical protein BC829DRAFT_391562 [Chytridium lagenaria]
MVVRGGVVASGIAAAAFLRAGVAYHLAPGYKETQNSTSLTPIDAGDGKGSPVVRIVRVDMMPGGMPLPETVEVSTQTDPLLCGAIVPPPNSLQHPDGVPTTTVGTSRSPTLFQSVLHKSATVATVLLASSSNYVFGAETTKKLMGEEETVACGKPCCIGEEGDVSPIRNLVVGGIYYATTLETLRRVPGSRLAKWFSETNKMTMKANGVMAKDGTLFLKLHIFFCI